MDDLGQCLAMRSSGVIDRDHVGDGDGVEEMVGVSDVPVVSVPGASGETVGLGVALGAGLGVSVKVGVDVAVMVGVSVGEGVVVGVAEGTWLGVELGTVLPSKSPLR